MGLVRRSLLPVFLSIQGAIYLLFLYRDFFRLGEGTVGLKYSTIILCLVFSCYWALLGGEKLVTAALALTLGADTCLLLLDRYYFVGMLFFCGTQGLYLWRIYRANGGRAWWPARLILLLLAVAAAAWLKLLTPFSGLCLLYFTNFLCNTIQSMRLSTHRLRLFSAGLILFLCCDLCVAVFNGHWLFPQYLVHFCRVGIWLYYLPAQVLIALSGLPDSMLRGNDDENQ